MRRLVRPLLALAAGLCPSASPAQTPPDKSDYTLFDPTPDDLLRPLATDRPGKSHSAITVDAGHIQIESDFWNDSFDAWSPDRVTSRETIYTDPNFKLGLTDWAEFDAILPVYQTLTTRDQTTGAIQRSRGVGDLDLGGKINFWGNAGGATSFGLIGFVKVPTAASGLGNNHVEAVANTPFTTTLPAGFSLTAEPGIGLMRNAANTGYAGDYQMILNLNHTVVVDNVTAALELFMDYSSDHTTGTRDTIDPSLQWQATKALQLDAGAYFGITKAAIDAEPYVGVTIRY